MNKTKLIRDFAKILLLVFIILLFDMHTVQSEAAVKDLKLNKTSAMLKVGETLQLKVSNAGANVKWSTDNAKVATVTNGLVSAKSLGTAVVTAASQTKSVTCKITVYQQAKKVELKPSSSYIEVGDTFTVNAKFTPADATYQYIFWSVEDDWWPAVEQVSKNQFKAVEQGTATIIAYQKATNKTYKVNIEVKEALGAFHIEKDGTTVTSLDAFIGGHIIVEGRMDEEDLYWYGDDPGFVYSVEDKSIAKIDDRGQITALSAGKTKVIVTAKNGKTKSCTLTVTNDREVLSIDTFYADHIYNGVGTGNYGDWMNWSNADHTFLFPLADGSIGVLSRTANEQGQSLMLYTYTKDLEYISEKKISLPYTEWGGLYQGEDGFYYAAVGQLNREQDDTKTVFSILKLNESFEEVGRCNITGAECSTRVPYDVGFARMTMSGTTLIVHTDRERYTTSDGLNHQSNITFVIDSVTMQQQYVGELFPYNHVSHSMNQFVKMEGGNLIYVDHGDAYPRTVVMQTHYNFTPSGWSDNYRSRPYTYSLDLINIAGEIGDNYTGTKVNGFEIGTYHNIVAGVSIPHDQLTAEDFADYDVKNVYVSLVAKDGTESELLWLTDYQSGKGVSAENLRMVKINDEFALIYQIVKKNEDSRTYGTGIIIIDSNGTVQQQKEYDTYFSTFTQPIYYDNSIVWIDSKLTTEDIYWYVDTEKTEEPKEQCQFTRIYLD